MNGLIFDGEDVVKVFLRGSWEHEVFGRGDPEAVVFETVDGVITAVFPESERYAAAISLEEKAEQMQDQE